MMAAWPRVVVCDGIPAEERAEWLVKNNSMTRDAAKLQVMREFPNHFLASVLPLEQPFENDTFGHVLKDLHKIKGLTVSGNIAAFPAEYRTWKRVQFEPDTFGHVLKDLIKEAGAVHLGGNIVLVPGGYHEMTVTLDTFGHVVKDLKKEVKAVSLGGDKMLFPAAHAFRTIMTFTPDTFGHVLKDMRKAEFTYLGGEQTLLPVSKGMWKRTTFELDTFGHNLKDLQKKGAIHLGGNEVLMAP